jgi:uncharacterized protein (DUF2235 family)
MASDTGSLPRKRIIVCCDGTWMDSDGELQVPSNVTNICRAIRHEGTNKLTGKAIPQIVYYQSGIGSTADSLYGKYIGGVTGKGISEHVRESYGFICHNYSPGDQIFLIGFSRGAFTARSVASLIRTVGLLTPIGMSYFYQIFQDWEFQLKEGWTTAYPNEPWPQRPPINAPEYRRKLLELELTRPDIPIKAVAVWDTVGALGIPSFVLFPHAPSKDYAFVDSKVDPNIEYAFQALALDERRRSYRPTIWEKPDGQEWPRVLKQVWFPGAHADIGGGHHNADLANLTLAWMISQLDELIDFDYGYVVRLNRLNMERHKQMGRSVREWGTGKIHDSMTLFFRLGGWKTRTPGEYRETERKHGSGGEGLQTMRRKLVSTGESIHSSVRIRMGRQGLGYNDKGTYDSEALQGWTMKATEEVAPPSPVDVHSPGAVLKGRISDVRWVKTIPGDKETPELILLEDELGSLERTVLESWPELYEEFDTIMPGSHATSMRRSSTFPPDHPHSNGVAAQMEMPKVDASAVNRKPHRESTI